MKKGMLLMVSSLIENTAEYQCEQFNYEMFGNDDEMLKVWSKKDGITSKQFHATRLISLINSIYGLNCFLQYNSLDERVELVIF